MYGRPIATNRKEFKPTLMHNKNASLLPCPELGIDKVLLNEIIKGMRKATELGTARRCQIKVSLSREKQVQVNGEIIT